MNLQLTDHLTCPACRDGGPLILLADRVEARRVYAGQLGCPGCSVRYPIVNGVPQFAEPAATPARPVAIDAVRAAALLGVTEGPGMLLFVGAFEEAARDVAGLLSDVEIVVAHGGASGGASEGVSLLRIGERLPLRDRSMRGALLADADADMIAEAVRVVGLAARVVMVGASPTGAAALRAESVQVLVQQDDTLVTVRHS